MLARDDGGYEIYASGDDVFLGDTFAMCSEDSTGQLSTCDEIVAPPGGNEYWCSDEPDGDNWCECYNPVLLRGLVSRLVTAAASRSHSGEHTVMVRSTRPHTINELSRSPWGALEAGATEVHSPSSACRDAARLRQGSLRLGTRVRPLPHSLDIERAGRPHLNSDH